MLCLPASQAAHLVFGQEEGKGGGLEQPDGVDLDGPEGRKNPKARLLPFHPSPGSMGLFGRLGAFFRPAPPPAGFPLPSALNRHTARGIGACLWFWIFYRAKNDGAALLVLPHAPAACRPLFCLLRLCRASATRSRSCSGSTANVAPLHCIIKRLPPKLRHNKQKIAAQYRQRPGFKGWEMDLDGWIGAVKKCQVLDEDCMKAVCDAVRPSRSLVRALSRPVGCCVSGRGAERPQHPHARHHLRGHPRPVF